MEFESLLHKCSNKGCECGTICLPIRSVNSIQCCVRIEKKKYVGTEISYYLVLDTAKGCIMEDEDEELHDHTYWRSPLDPTDLKTSVKTTLDSLRFNRKKNKFETTPAYDWDFLQSENVKLNYTYEECCVCHETTESKTTCGHTLCIPCYDQIRVDSDDDTLCPLCRADCYIHG